MKIIFFANTDWYLYNFRLSIALRLQAHGFEVVMLSPPGEFGHRFAAHGIRWVAMSMDRGGLNPVSEAMTLARLVRILRVEQPDLLHNFTTKCAIYGALAARLTRVPAVVNAVAGMGYVFTSDQPKARALRPIVTQLMRLTFGGEQSRLILQNPDDVDAFLSARMVSESRTRLIRSSGVDTTRFCPCVDGERVEPRRPLRVLLAARLLWEKGIAEFVQAAALLREQGRSVELLLAGMPDPGNPGSVTREEVERWDRDKLIQWLGHVDDMPTLLRSVQVMALPSYYREGVPRSLTEAAACGLALVTTNLPGCREVVCEHGLDGLHVNARDADSLAAALARLDDDRELLDRLGKRARQRALTDFDERNVIDRTLDVYGELLPGRLPAACPTAQ